MRRDQLITECLVVRHRSEACARGGVQFPHPRNCLDVQQLQATRLQQPCIFIGIVTTRPANGGNFGHLTLCELIQKLIRVPVVIRRNMFKSLGRSYRAFLEVSENLGAPLLLLPVDLMSVQRESCINSDKNDCQFNKSIDDHTCPKVFRRFLDRCAHSASNGSKLSHLPWLTQVGNIGTRGRLHCLVRWL